MKTTVVLPDSLLQAARRAAREDRTTLRDLLLTGLQLVLARREESRRFVLRDASVGGNGLQPEFQSAGWEQIRDAAYGDSR